MLVATRVDEEAEIVRLLQSQDVDAALDAFNQVIGRGLFHFLQTRFARSGVETEDVYQETLVKLWQRIDSFDAARGGLRTWVYTIARNVAIDRIRRDAATLARLQDEFTGFARAHSEFGLYRS